MSWVGPAIFAIKAKFETEFSKQASRNAKNRIEDLIKKIMGKEAKFAVLNLHNFMNVEKSQRSAKKSH